MKLTEQQAATLKHYKTAAGMAIIVGWLLTIGGMHHLFGWAGAEIAVGVPLMAWGWEAAKTIIETEVM